MAAAIRIGWGAWLLYLALACTPAHAQTLSPLAQLLLGMVRGRATGLAGVANLTGSATSTDTAFHAACEEVGKLAPPTLDDATRFEGCVAVAGKTVMFKLTLV